MKSKWLILILTLISLSSTNPSWAEESQAKNANKPSEPLYLVYVSNQWERPFTLKNLRSCKLEEIDCLCGNFVGESWLQDQVAYIPKNTIAAAYEFTSAEEYKMRVDKYNAQNPTDQGLMGKLLGQQ